MKGVTTVYALSEKQEKGKVVSDLIKHEYEGFYIPQREEDGYVSLTAMAKTAGKDVAAYLRLASSKAYIAGLEGVHAKSHIPLVFVNKSTGSNEDRGTWAHPDVAMDFAQWVSVPFRIWANQTLVQRVSRQAGRPETASPAIAGPTEEERITMLTTSLATLGLLDSPRHMQLARDRVALLMGQKVLPIAEPEWFGVAEIAEQMGYSAYAVSKVRTGLGKVIASWYRSVRGAEPPTERRIINGRTCEPKVYQRCAELDNMIAAYLQAKGVSA